MKNKRKTYIDFTSVYGNNGRRRHNNRRRGRKTGLYVFVVLLFAIILGVGTYFITKGNLKIQDQTLQAQEKLSIPTPIMDKDITEDDNAKIEVDKAELDKAVVDKAEVDKAEVDIAEVDKDIIEGTADDVKTTITKPNKTEEASISELADTRSPIKVKGIYVTGPRAGTKSYMKELINLVETTELNAMVIDIKNDSGEITYKMGLEQAQEIGANVNYISNMELLIKELKEKDIYLIARIVAFKDPILAVGKPELSLKNKDGTTFKDKAGHSWVNPYKKEVWEYLLSVAKEAVELGFDEIQFDYIRFSTDSGIKAVDFGDNAKGKTKIEVISEFTKYVSEELKPLGVYVSADVYGAIIDSEVDANIVGQSYVEMSKYLDYICPMIYPSHYADGAYGIEYPDLEPKKLITKALDKSMTVLGTIDEDGNKAVVRPWLQDFTATWLTNHKAYGPEEIRAQIQAVYDTGYEEWILWNGSNNYTKEALFSE